MERLSNTNKTVKQICSHPPGAVGLEIYYRYDFRKDPYFLKKLLLNVQTISATHPVKKIQGMYAETARCTKSLGFNQGTIENMEKEIVKGTFSNLIFSHESGIFDGGIHIYDAVGTNPLASLSIMISNELIVVEENLMGRLIEFAKRFWESVGGIYGFIAVGPSWNFVTSECSAIGYGTFGKEPTPEEIQHNSELGFYKRRQDLQTDFLRKAYWANFLNRTHVEKLGGFDFIKSKAPCLKVEELPEGGAYLQLTESPLDFSRSDFPEHLKTLDDFFQPAILPGRPPVVFGQAQ